MFLTLSILYIYIPLHPSVLAPASIVNVLPSELHFSRSLEGEPIVIPSRVASPPPPLPLPPLKKGDRSAGVQELQFALIQTSLMRPSTIRFQYVFCLSLEISRSLSLSLSLSRLFCVYAYPPSPISPTHSAGIYGRHTASAVAALQAACGMLPSGVYDDEARAVLTKLLGDASARCVDARHASTATTPTSVQQAEDALFMTPPLFPSEVYGRLAAAGNDGHRAGGIHGWSKSHSGLQEAGTTPPLLSPISPSLAVSPRIELGWREQLGSVAATSIASDDVPIAVVQGSRSLLIPHEPVVSGATLIARVCAMQQRPARGGGNVLAAAVSSEPTNSPSASTRLQKAQLSVEHFASQVPTNSNAGRTLWLPPELTQSERGELHALGEAYGLGHVSIGEGLDRRALLLWKGEGWTPSGPAVSDHGDGTPRTPPSKTKSKKKRLTNALVGNPAALIEVVDGIEVSRGFVLPPSWRLAATPMVSRSEAIANERWSKDTLLSLAEATSPVQNWYVDMKESNSGRKGKGKGRRGRGRGRRNHQTEEEQLPTVWVKLTLPATGVNGESLLAALHAWLLKVAVAETRGQLHSVECRARLSYALRRCQDPIQLLFDLIEVAAAWPDAAQRKAVMARAHGIVGALAATDGTEEAARIAVLAAEEPAAEADMDVAYTGEKREVGTIQLLDGAANALAACVAAVNAGEVDDVWRGKCRLYIKALPVVERADEDAGAVPLLAASPQHSALALTIRTRVNAAVASAIRAMQADAIDGISDRRKLTVLALGADLKVFTSLLRRSDDDDVAGGDEDGGGASELQDRELMHWLVRGGDLQAAARLATTKPLRVTMIQELLARKGKSTLKAAVRYISMFHLRDIFPEILEEQRARRAMGKQHHQTARRAELQHQLAPTASLPSSCNGPVHVRSAASLAACVAALRMHAEVERAEHRLGVVAIDAEWKPGNHPVSIVQLATASIVYLVDLLALGELSVSAAPLWQLLAIELVVVGFGLAGDMKMCCEWHADCPRRWEKTLDLQALARPAKLTPRGRTDAEIGLGALTVTALGVKMDKTQQTSDWSVRPLSAAQREYAALDAYILIPLLDAIFSKLVAIEGGDISQWVRAIEVRGGARSSSAVDASCAVLGSERVRQALLAAGLDAAAASIGFSSVVAASVGGSESTVCKTLALTTQRGELVLCVLPLTRRLLMQRCAAAVGVRRAHLGMVRTDDLVAVVGFPRGAVGPAGALRSATVLIDAALVGAEGEGGEGRRVMCGAGEVGVQFAATVGQLLLLPGARIATFSTDEG